MTHLNQIESKYLSQEAVHKTHFKLFPSEKKAIHFNYNYYNYYNYFNYYNYYNYYYNYYNYLLHQLLQQILHSYLTNY